MANFKQRLIYMCDHNNDNRPNNELSVSESKHLSGINTAINYDS